MARILVVDDSPSALVAARCMLEEDEHHVATCSSGKAVRALLRDERFDLVITDIYMPEEDGLELIRELRTTCETPIVAMSGMTGHMDMLPVARRLGAASTLTKPFSKSQLRKALAESLERVR